MVTLMTGLPKATTASLLVLAFGATAEQRVEIYTGGDADEPGADDPSNNTLIWVDGSCEEGLIAQLECSAVDADTIGQYMGETLDVLPGGDIGLENDDGGRTLHVIVYNQGVDVGHYDRDFKSVHLPRGWQRGPKGTVHHETGHAFVDQYLGTKTCDGSAQHPCSETLVEHWGVDEGIASILDESVGKGYVGPAPADSVREIMDDHCSIDEYPDGGEDCAHNIGRLVVKAFDELKAIKGESYARSVYMDAVIALRSPWATAVSVRDLQLQVGREIAEREDVHFGEPEAAALTEGDFSIDDLLALLKLLGLRDVRDDDPDYSPH